MADDVIAQNLLKKRKKKKKKPWEEDVFGVQKPTPSAAAAKPKPKSTADEAIEIIGNLRKRNKSIVNLYGEAPRR